MDTLVVLLGRMVLLIVTRWFVLGARERERERERETSGFLHVRAALRGVIPYFLGGFVCEVCLHMVFPEW
jgi:hypothetical protein